MRGCLYSRCVECDQSPQQATLNTVDLQKRIPGHAEPMKSVVLVIANLSEVPRW